MGYFPNMFPWQLIIIECRFIASLDVKVILVLFYNSIMIFMYKINKVGHDPRMTPRVFHILFIDREYE